MYAIAGFTAIMPLRKGLIRTFLMPSIMTLIGAFGGFLFGTPVGVMVGIFYEYMDERLPGYIALTWGLLISCLLGSSAFSKWTSIL